MPHDAWRERSYERDGAAHVYYARGDEVAPAVLLLHEFPGITPELQGYADALAQDFRVYVPSLFGEDFVPMTCRSSLRAAVGLCVSTEMHLLARDGVSRSVPWLRGFAREVVGEAGRPYGVIGLCLTGGFALALAADPQVAAAVVGEPAAPPLPGALGLSAEDREALADRSGLRVQGYRYVGDSHSPAAKLRAAERLLGTGRMRRFELTDGPPEVKRPHSTLTHHPSPTAVTGVRDFLLDRLSESA
ncbi:dienelactone hydrolase family protein [Demequina mangrovi]|uniref:Dienelactone hydrolase n=1 Tax=Demequina mangrovi TaxID=1043493 RepID=A0A1H6WBC4_9MICO|nr:dienelactone hydrolase family protein [Demequina mangrovi]SEJ11357.1 Dienelactone hydrolase [Demequina mangrovi]